ncbi:MAG TPA: histidine kinase [Candidatus Limnocylindrales bacterium]|jgi:signal transduction histidine kinase
MVPSRDRWPPLVSDLGPIVVLLILASALRPGIREGTDPTPTLLILVPLAVRRLWPFRVLALVAAIAVLTSVESPMPWIQVVAVALASYATGEAATDRTRSSLGVIAIAGLMAIGFLAQDLDSFESLVYPFVVVVPTWLVGDVVRTRGAEREALADRERRTAREAEDRLQAAVAEERRHMARELHDVVAHGVSVMVIQAGAARQVVEATPDRATDSLLTIEATGRDVMAELRRLLGVLNDDGEASGIAPQPGIEQVPPLVERIRQAGLPAELEIDGTPRTLPASLDVTAYRIIQEALTNALRYARRARTIVRLSYEPDQLRVEVLDDGPADTTEASEGSGRGLVGMQQRASLAGGRLEAGPRLGGGYAVRAWLPTELEPEPA